MHLYTKITYICIETIRIYSENFPEKCAIEHIDIIISILISIILNT